MHLHKTGPQPRKSNCCSKGAHKSPLWTFQWKTHWLCNGTLTTEADKPVLAEGRVVGKLGWRDESRSSSLILSATSAAFPWIHRSGGFTGTARGLDKSLMLQKTRSSAVAEEYELYSVNFVNCNLTVLRSAWEKRFAIGEWPWISDYQSTSYIIPY